MERRHYLMSWPNLDFKEGFYVTKRQKASNADVGSRYMIGYKITDERNHYNSDSQQTITRQAYMALKALAVRNRRRILAANRQQARKERKQACTSSSTKPPE